MSIDIKFGLKNDAKAVYCSLNRRTEFFLVVHNFQGHYLPSVRVILTGPPQLRLVIKNESYGGIGNGRKKSRLFKIIPKAEGVFTLTAILSSKRVNLLTLQIEVIVGNVQIPSSPIIQQVQDPIVKKPVTLINCGYCHEKIDSDAKFCPHCGSNLAEKPEKTVKICSNCGAELPNEAKFCAKCGEKTT
ncbi:hypothetical protein LCGC14_0706920 [marine sediment metagenome]|uniref:DZANK-type domain-containing protein n=1 Tax=marine sediment metagenome TaxID=412755 RepID=A0A0F9QKR7_9ZZZZ|nr:MAG: Double zinc ribbon [Candidatus Lokiarchaeum sp. GC14_75]